MQAMNHNNHQKIKEIFNDALERAPAEREAFLMQVCDGDENLRQAVETLLATYQTDFLEKPAVSDATEFFGKSNSPLKTGEKIGRYEIKDKIGSGGMGEVFLAQDKELKRQVAVKILRAEVAKDKERIRRFLQEARAVSTLNHPNIITVHEVGEFNGSKFIVSEFVHGETLREKLLREPLSVEESLDVIIQVAAALNAAHCAGIIHRDIKPENIMVRKDGLVKVLDFGLAKLIDEKLENFDSKASTISRVQTASGMIMGTVAYMSPEQARGKETDARTDVWSLGVVLYEMLTGKRPFTGETTSDTIAAILKNEPESIYNCNSPIPFRLEQSILKALQKDIQERYQSVNELLLDIKEIKRQLDFENEYSRPGSKLSTNLLNALNKQTVPPTTQQRTKAATGENNPLTVGNKIIGTEDKQNDRERFYKFPWKVLLGIPIFLALVGISLLGRSYFTNVNNSNAVKLNKNQEVAVTNNSPRRGNMIFISGGTFMMGRDEKSPFPGERHESPMHSVSVKAFFMDRTEVTNAEYYQFVRETGHTPPPHWDSLSWNNTKFVAEEGMFPVVNISLEDAKAFAVWRSKRDGVNYRLPSEQEWEYAARGGDQNHFYPWGSIWIEGKANVNTGILKRVGSHPEGQNRWGVHDLIGNVWEWTSSEVSLYLGSKDELKSVSNDYIIRGGSFNSLPRNERGTPMATLITATQRNWINSSLKDTRVGFRLVSTDPQSKSYFNMSETERFTFIKEGARVINELSEEKPKDFDQKELSSIKNEIDDYLETIDSVSQKPFEEGLRVIYGRATQYVPIIRRSYEARKVPPALGIYQAMVESEYHDCLKSETGNVGLFQFKRETAAKYGLNSADYCDIEKQSRAAAHYMSDLLSDFDDKKSLALFAFNHGENGTRDLLRQLRSRNINERDFWVIYENVNELQIPQDNGSRRYVQRFFAAAIIGENPQMFDLPIPPLSTVR